MAHLSQAQKNAFIENGFVVVRNLLDSERITKCRNLFQEQTGLVFDDANTWPEGVTDWHPIRDEGFEWDHDLAIAPEIQEIVHELAGPHVHLPRFSPVLRLPQPGPKVHEMKGVHIDAKYRGITPYPSELYLIVFGYLTDVDHPYDAPFSAYPGSPRKVFEYSQQPGVDLGEEYKPKGASLPDLDYGDPIGITGKAGDVIFAHFLLAHSPSFNRGDHVRFGVRGEAKAPDFEYVPKTGEPQDDWTPIDWSLRTDNLGEVV